jgi:hypothetical protein
MGKDYKLEYRHFVHRSMYADQCFDDAVTYDGSIAMIV